MKKTILMAIGILVIITFISGCSLEKENIISPSHYSIQNTWEGSFSTRAWGGEINTEVSNNKITKSNISTYWSHLAGSTQKCFAKYINSNSCWKGNCNSTSTPESAPTYEEKEWGCNETHKIGGANGELNQYQDIFNKAKESYQKANNQTMPILTKGCLDYHKNTICFNNSYITYYAESTKEWNITIL